MLFTGHSAQLKGTDVLSRLLQEVQQEAITVADLIRLWVTQEVADYYRLMPDQFNGLVEPTRTLNSNRLRRHRSINSDEQIETALRAFRQSGFRSGAVYPVGGHRTHCPGVFDNHAGC